MNSIMRRYSSPSLVVSIIALIVALGGAGYSATGGNFILGRSNVATTPSALTAHLNGRTLQLVNANTGASATPLALFAAAGHPRSQSTPPPRSPTSTPTGWTVSTP